MRSSCSYICSVHVLSISFMPQRFNAHLHKNMRVYFSYPIIRTLRK
nr:MAG TPA: hypothetical protein [Caudoviricetes sp.]